MKKTLTATLTVATLVAMTGNGHAVSSTKSYKVSVTIPAIIGVNTDIPSTEIDQPQTAKNSIQDTYTEEVIRDNQTILLTSMVAK